MSSSSKDFLNYETLVEKHSSTDRSEPLVVFLAGELERAALVGRLPPQFLIRHISHGPWYAAMIEFAKRLRQPNTLERVIRGMCGTTHTIAADGKPLILGCGETGLQILEHLVTSPVISADSLLAIDWDQRRLMSSQVPRKLLLPYAPLRLLQWAGIHHGGADHRRISGIAAIPNLMNELDDASKLLIVTGFDSPLGPGITPVLAALCKQTNRPMHVIAVMPLEVRHRPRRAPSVPWQEAIAATQLLEELSASVEVLDPQTVVDEHTSESLTLAGLYEFLTKSAAIRARSAMS